jgi:hypothetical protein
LNNEIKKRVVAGYYQPRHRTGKIKEKLTALAPAQWESRQRADNLFNLKEVQEAACFIGNNIIFMRQRDRKTKAGLMIILAR